MANNDLAVIDGETLADMRLPPAQYCVKSLLHQGVTILGGRAEGGKVLAGPVAGRDGGEGRAGVGNVCSAGHDVVPLPGGFDPAYPKPAL